PQRKTSDSIGQMPAKIYDAMAMAKPIVATCVSDIPEVLGDSGYLVDPGEPSQLASAIQYILSHPDEAHGKALAARERCRQMYDMKNLESGLQELVAQVTATQGGA
ncbi:MAG TPA: glycosyltransferase, partial [Nitrospinaceae bacterium]|nr:glycosyltransferase [Nitrospinaceae bacterium]